LLLPFFYVIAAFGTTVVLPILVGLGWFSDKPERLEAANVCCIAGLLVGIALSLAFTQSIDPYYGTGPSNTITNWERNPGRHIPLVIAVGIASVAASALAAVEIRADKGLHRWSLAVLTLATLAGFPACIVGILTAFTGH
jgi:hypothetical protein